MAAQCGCSAPVWTGSGRNPAGLGRSRAPEPWLRRPPRLFPGPGGRTYTRLLWMAEEQAMQSLQIERQAHQAALAGRRSLAPQRELTEAQHLLDNPDYRFHGTLTGRI